MVFLSYLGVAWLVIALVVFFATSIGALLQPFLQGGRAENPEQPPVTAVMPIKLEHSGFAEAQASVFNQNYPEYEVLFSAAEASSPALETALALKMNHPQVPTRILRSQSDFAVSPKLNTLDAPLLASSHDFILVKDLTITPSAKDAPPGRPQSVAGAEEHGVLLRDRHRAGEQAVDQLVGALEEGDRLVIFIAAFDVGQPSARLAGIIQVEHRCDRVDAQTVDVEAVDPIERAGAKRKLATSLRPKS